jgi:uncharacterized protein YdaU (DUF1376 family)
MAENSVDIWMPWYPSDYLKKTITLTLEEDAIYRRSIDFLWQNPQGIPKETRRLCLALRIDSSNIQMAISILDQYLTLENGFYFSQRVTEEREKAIHNRETQRLNGSKGGRPHKPTGSIPLNPRGNPNHNPNESPSPSPSPSNFTFKNLEEIFGKAKSGAEEKKFFDAFQGFLKLETNKDEISKRAEQYKKNCPNLAFTPYAVLHNWEKSAPKAKKPYNPLNP